MFYKFLYDSFIIRANISTPGPKTQEFVVPYWMDKGKDRSTNNGPIITEKQG